MSTNEVHNKDLKNVGGGSNWGFTNYVGERYVFATEDEANKALMRMGFIGEIPEIKKTNENVNAELVGQNVKRIGEDNYDFDI